MYITTETGDLPSGPANGDLSSFYPDPIVSGIQGRPISATAPTINQVLEWTGSAWTPTSQASGITFAGDLYGNPSSQNVINIHGASVPVAGSLTPGNTLQVSGSSSLTYAPVNLAGGSNYVIGQLPTGSQVAQNLTLLGDVTGSGTTAGTTTTVVKINGTSVPASPSANQVLVATSSSVSTWAQISDAQVSNTAAIAGTKINPAFGSQNVSTTGSLTSGSFKDTGLSTGIGHLDSSGNLTSSLIVNADISNIASISVNKLAVGSSAQILLNNGVPTPTWTTLSGDGYISFSGVLNITGMQGYPIEAQALTYVQDGYVLTWNNAADQWRAEPPIGGGGGSFTAGGDLTGSDFSQTVIQAQNGAITFASSSGLIGFASGDTGPGLLQSARASDLATHDLVVTSQSAYPSASTNINGANLKLTAGSPATASGSGGSIYANVAAPIGEAAEAAFVFTRGGNNYASLQGSPSSSYLYMGKSVTPGSNNYSLITNSGNANLNINALTSTALNVNANTIIIAYATEAAAAYNFAIGATTGGTYGGGLGGVISVATATTNPNTSVTPYTAGTLLHTGDGYDGYNAFCITPPSGPNPALQLLYFNGEVTMLYGSAPGEQGQANLSIVTTLVPIMGKKGGSIQINAQNGDGYTTNGGDIVFAPGNSGGGSGSPGRFLFQNATVSGSSSGASGQYLVIQVNNVNYKLALYNT